MVDPKTALLRLFDTRVAGLILDVLDRTDRGRPGRIVALTYHRIDHPTARPHLWPGLISASPDAFARQMELVARRFVVIGMDQLLAIRRGERPVQPRTVMVTIDDAYADAAEHAWPVLQRVGIPATLFVPTAAPTMTAGFWWDRLYHAISISKRRLIEIEGGAHDLSRDGRPAAFAAAREAVRGQEHHAAMALVNRLVEDLDVADAPPETLGWASLKLLAAQGLTLGAHTRSHPRLDKLSLPEATGEIAGSLQDLERETGSVLPVLAYPSGDHGAPATDASSAAGIVAAFTTRRAGIDVGSADWQRLPRVNVGGRTGIGLLRAQLGSGMRLLGR